jgi:hypothetical protein
VNRKIPTKKEIQFDAKKEFFLIICGRGQIGGKNSVYIVELHVKLRPKRIKIVEMRA